MTKAGRSLVNSTTPAGSGARAKLRFALYSRRASSCRGESAGLMLLTCLLCSSEEDDRATENAGQVVRETVVVFASAVARPRARQSPNRDERDAGPRSARASVLPGCLVSARGALRWAPIAKRVDPSLQRLPVLPEPPLHFRICGGLGYRFIVLVQIALLAARC